MGTSKARNLPMDISDEILHFRLNIGASSVPGGWNGAKYTPWETARLEAMWREEVTPYFWLRVLPFGRGQQL